MMSDADAGERARAIAEHARNWEEIRALLRADLILVRMIQRVYDDGRLARKQPKQEDGASA